MDVRNSLFEEPYPASTLMIVSGFARPEFVIEIEVVAAIPG
jgi:enamine deaminase RidA (YjgF/YER057c/UK114 family)